MVKKLEFTSEQHISLIHKCEKLNIEFMSSAFDLKSLELLNELCVKRFKIPSGEITNLPYLRKIAKFSIPTISNKPTTNINGVSFTNAKKVLAIPGITNFRACGKITKICIFQ